MTIRPAHKQDIPEVLDIWVAFMDYLQIINSNYYELINKDDFSIHLHYIIESPENHLIVAEEENGIIGFILGYEETLPAWFGSGKIGLIRYLAIREHFQNKGTGQLLFKAMRDWFLDKDIDRIELYVLEGLPANEFWKKMGFKSLMDRKFLNIG